METPGVHPKNELEFMDVNPKDVHNPPPYSKNEKPVLIVWYRFGIIHHAMLWLLRNYPGFESDEYNLPESIQFRIFRGKSRRQFILAFA